MLLSQIAELSHLPSSLRVLISTVTAVDIALLFFMGAGLLTMKRKWVDAVLAASVISLVAFYIVPLRPAIPLEIVVIMYLISKRGGISLKRLKHIIPIGLLAVLTGQTLAVNPCSFFRSQGTLVQYHEVMSDKGGVRATLGLYKEADAIPTTDFYYFEATIHCIDWKFSCVTVNASALVPEAEAYDWSPQTALGSVLHIGLGVSTFSIGSPKIVRIEFGTNENPLVWRESLMTPMYEEVFSARYFVPEGMNFTFSITAQVRLEDEIFGNLWNETLAFSNAP
jgi:hypothetical protein